MNRIKREEQLVQYVIDDYEFGRIDLPGSVNVSVEKISFNEILLCTGIKGSLFWFEYVNYSANYYVEPNSFKVLLAFTKMVIIRLTK